MKRNQAIDLLRDRVIKVGPDGNDHVKVREERFHVRKDRLVTLMEAGRLDVDTILQISRETIDRLASEAIMALDSQLDIFEIKPLKGHAGAWCIDFVAEDGEHVEVAIDRRIVGMDESAIKEHIKTTLDRWPSRLTSTGGLPSDLAIGSSCSIPVPTLSSEVQRFSHSRGTDENYESQNS